MVCMVSNTSSSRQLDLLFTHEESFVGVVYCPSQSTAMFQVQLHAYDHQILCVLRLIQKYGVSFKHG